MQHGDLVRDGDEFNREPHYWCDFCRFAHGKGYKNCFNLLPPPPRTFQGMGHLFTNPPDKDPLVAVIDRQLEIERKARAWDSLRSAAGRIAGAYTVRLSEDGAGWTITNVPSALDGLAGPRIDDQGPGKG